MHPHPEVRIRLKMRIGKIPQTDMIKPRWFLLNHNVENHISSLQLLDKAVDRSLVLETFDQDAQCDARTVRSPLRRS